MRGKLLRVAAWVVTLGILGYLFYRVPVNDVVSAARNAAWWAVPAILGIVLAVYVTDCFAMWRTFSWFVTPLRFGEVLTLRGATYLLALVNYALGQGAIVYFVNRSRGVPVVRGAAAVLLIMGVNLLVLLFMTTAGVALGGESFPALRPLLIVAYAGLAVYVALVAWKPRWLARRPLFDVLLGAGIKGYLKAMLVRLPHVTTLLVLNHVALWAFGAKVPVLQTLLYMPIVFLIAVLPISVQGLGTTQLFMQQFFARYVPGDRATQEATILAASLGVQALAWCFQIAVGLICLRSQLTQSLKDMPAPAPATPP